MGSREKTINAMVELVKTNNGGFTELIKDNKEYLDRIYPDLSSNLNPFAFANDKNSIITILEAAKPMARKLDEYYAEVNAYIDTVHELLN